MFCWQDEGQVQAWYTSWLSEAMRNVSLYTFLHTNVWSTKSDVPGYVRNSQKRTLFLQIKISASYNYRLNFFEYPHNIPECIEGLHKALVPIYDPLNAGHSCVVLKDLRFSTSCDKDMKNGNWHREEYRNKQWNSCFDCSRKKISKFLHKVVKRVRRALVTELQSSFGLNFQVRNKRAVR